MRAQLNDGTARGSLPSRVSRSVGGGEQRNVVHGDIHWCMFKRCEQTPVIWGNTEQSRVYRVLLTVETTCIPRDRAKDVEDAYQCGDAR